MNIDNERPKICNMNLNIDDWLEDDCFLFAQKVLKDILLLEEDDCLETNRIDQLFLSVCNKVHQCLYKEVDRLKMLDKADWLKYCEDPHNLPFPKSRI